MITAAGGLRGLALQVARCPSVQPARSNPGHPCHTIVSSQPSSDALWQVPEPWAGNLERARIVFLSSNPSISEAAVGSEGQQEAYPVGDWPDDQTAEFVIQRFQGQWATPDGRFRRRDGGLSRPVAFWSRVRSRAGELLGRTADPACDYVMTEVVHCKSRNELGVSGAVGHCSQLHMDAILRATTAPLVVVLGARARDQVTELWKLPDAFGDRRSTGGEEQHVGLAIVGGSERLVVHLPHPTGMEPNSTFAKAYPRLLPLLRQLVAGGLTPQDFTSQPAPVQRPRRESVRLQVHKPDPAPPLRQRLSEENTSMDTHKVIVVAAGTAWPFYRSTAAYVCQADKQFGDAGLMGFYSKRTIHGAAARIEQVVPVVLSQANAARRALSLDPLEQRLGNVIAAALASAWKEGEPSTVVLLSALDEADTVTFNAVVHDAPAAWTMNRRYAWLEDLVKAKTTADLTRAPGRGQADA